MPPLSQVEVDLIFVQDSRTRASLTLEHEERHNVRMSQDVSANWSRWFASEKRTKAGNICIFHTLYGHSVCFVILLC